MNGDRLCSAFLSNTGDLYGVHVLFVPALSYLDRYGNIGGFYNSLNDMSEKNGIFHKCRACAVACYIRYGTAAVYIYEVGFVLCRNNSRLCHKFRLTAEKLYCHRTLIIGDGKQACGFPVGIAQPFCTCHFSRDVFHCRFKLTPFGIYLVYYSTFLSSVQ